MRYYIAGVIFVIFDILLVLLVPWSAVFGNTANPFAVRWAAMVDLLVFLAPLGVGFAWLWRFGYFDFAQPAATRTAQTDRDSARESAAVDPGDQAARR